MLRRIRPFLLLARNDPGGDSHRDQAAEHPSRIADALGVLPSDDLEFDIIIRVDLELAIRMVGIPHGTPVPKRQAEDRMPDRIGIGQIPGQFVQMRQAEQFHAMRRRCKSPPAFVRYTPFHRSMGCKFPVLGGKSFPSRICIARHIWISLGFYRTFRHAGTLLPRPAFFEGFLRGDAARLTAPRAGHSRKLSEYSGNGPYFRGKTGQAWPAHSFRLWSERRGGIGRIRNAAPYSGS